MRKSGRFGCAALVLAAVGWLGVGGFRGQAQTDAAPEPDYIARVRLSEPATVPVRVHGWENGAPAEPGTAFTAAVVGDVYEGSTTVIPSGTPVVGRVLRVEERGLDGAPRDVVLALDWAALPGADGKPEMASISTRPLSVRLTPDDIRDARVFWFHTSEPLTVGIPVIYGELQDRSAADESSLYPHPLKGAALP